MTADIDPNMLRMNGVNSLEVNRLGTLTIQERSDWIVKDAWQTFSNSRLMNEVSRLRNDIEAE